MLLQQVALPICTRFPTSSQAYLGTGPHSLHATLGVKSYTQPWFKSTLLLFLRLLLSTKKKKKKDGLPNLFFFFFQEKKKKQATENGILQIYKHREGSATHIDGLVLGRLQTPAQAGWHTPQLTYVVSHSRAQPIPDRSAHQGPGHPHCHLPPPSPPQQRRPAH